MANAMTTAFLHGAPVALADIPRMDTDRFRDEVLGQVAGGAGSLRSSAGRRRRTEYGCTPCSRTTRQAHFRS